WPMTSLDDLGDLESLPHVGGTLVERLLGLPAELGVGAVDFGDARSDVAGAAADLVDGHLAAGRGLDGIDDLGDGVPGTGAQVEGPEALELALAGSPDGGDMALSKVDDYFQ